MPAQGISMRKLTQLVRLHIEAKLSTRNIGRSLSLSVGVVSKYINRIKQLNMNNDDLLGMSESSLAELLKPKTAVKAKSNKQSKLIESIDFSVIHQEMKIKGVTAQLLWEEYAQGNSNPLSYSRFCHHYREWKAKQPRSMRQTHKAGDKVFVDYSGKKIAVIDPDTGEIRYAEIFIGVLGASNFSFAEATWSQQLPDWIGSHIRMFDYFGCVPALIVPDNLKSAINKSCRYEQDTNPTYHEFVIHYNTAVLPTRPYSPKDKAKVECGVQLVQRWILAKLRHHTFVGLGELNTEIRKLLDALNDKPFQKLPGSRRSAFESLDKPAMQALPQQRYEYKSYKKARVNIDYHIELDGHYYSIPHRYCKEQVDLWFSKTLLSCYFNGECIAQHAISQKKGAHSTIKEHMPEKHQKHMSWTPGRFLNWAKDIGPYTLQITEYLLNSKSHPEQSYRACLGLLNLAKRYGKDRLESACLYGWNSGARSRKSIASILDKGMDKQPVENVQEFNPGLHENLRGPNYYH